MEFFNAWRLDRAVRALREYMEWRPGKDWDVEVAKRLQRRLDRAAARCR